MKPEARFDVRRGVNTAASPEVLTENEVRRAKNMVLTQHGALVTRMGSQRIHTEAEQPIKALTRWFDPALQKWTTVIHSGLSMLAKSDDQAEFRGFGLTDIATVGPVRFARWRVGAGIVLVWVDSTLGLQYTSGEPQAGSAPAPRATYLRPFKGRLYLAGDPLAPKRFYGSKANDFTVWDVSAGAVLGDAEQYDHEPINGLATVGGSLLIYKEDAIQRWTGTSSSDFNLERDSEGIARRVGLIAPDTLVEVERLAMHLSDLGPYAITEGGLQAIGEQLDDQWRSANKALWKDAVASWNDDGHQWRLFLPGAGQDGNYRGWYWNAALSAWTGPHEMRTIRNGEVAPLGPTAMAEYELPTGETLTMFGAADGFVRVMDRVPLDDVHADGSGGVPIEWEVEYPTLHFGSLRTEKALDQLVASMLLPPGQQATAFWQVDSEPEETATVDGVSREPFNYDFGRLPSVGKRIRLGFRGLATEQVSVLGFELDAEPLRLI